MRGPGGVLARIKPARGAGGSGHVEEHRTVIRRAVSRRDIVETRELERHVDGALIVIELALRLAEPLLAR